MNITRLSDVKSQKQEFILKDVMPLPKNTVAMLSSSGGVAKTWLGLRIAMKHVKDTDEEVMLWMTEDEAPFIKNRADSLSQYAKVETDYRKIHLINDAPPQLAKREGGVFKANYEALKEVRSECIDRGITFIVLDPLITFYGGNENDNAEARVFMQSFLQWAKEDEVTILLLHHSKKDGTGSRGASAFVDAVRTVYELDFVMAEPRNKGDAPTKNHIATDKGLRMLKLVKDNRHVQGVLQADGKRAEYQVEVTPEYRATSCRV